MNQQVKKILNSEVGREVREYLYEEAMKLRDINNIPDTYPSDVSVETRARKLAYKILEEILDFQEVKQRSPKDKFFHIPK